MMAKMVVNLSYGHLRLIVALLGAAASIAGAGICALGLAQIRSKKLPNAIDPEKLAALGGEEAMAKRLGRSIFFCGVMFFAFGVYVAVVVIRG